MDRRPEKSGASSDFDEGSGESEWKGLGFGVAVVEVAAGFGALRGEGERWGLVRETL